ncbi:MAG: hypothetical protein ACFFG0_08060 [Candidatus Thorarchaeota archaeon]
MSETISEIEYKFIKFFYIVSKMQITFHNCMNLYLELYGERFPYQPLIKLLINNSIQEIIKFSIKNKFHVRKSFLKIIEFLKYLREDNNLKKWIKERDKRYGY